MKVLWASCGEQDGLFYVAQGVHDYLAQNNVPHNWYRAPGNHDFTFWKDSLYQFSQLIFKGNVTPTPTPTPSPTRIECENMTKSGTYAGNITSPFSGVALYANGDYCANDYNFSTAKTYTIQVRGASNNSGTAKVAVYVGGVKKGTLNFTGTTPSVQSLNISLNAGSQQAKLQMDEDTGAWDVFVDYYEIN